MNARDRRALQLGAGIVIGAWLFLRLIPATVRAERTLRERVARQSATVERLKADMALLPALEDSAAVLSKALSQLAPRLVTGSTLPEGEAELTVLVRSLSESLGARVERIVPLADSASAGSLTRVAVRLEVETDTKGAAQLLASVARQATVLDIASLRILALEPNSAAAVAERLRVELVVSGWMLAKGANGAKGAKGATGRGLDG